MPLESPLSTSLPQVSSIISVTPRLIKHIHGALGLPVPGDNLHLGAAPPPPRGHALQPRKRWTE